MWNPFKKNKRTDNNAPKLSAMERFAMRQFEKMTPEQKEKAMKKAMKPENVQKNKDKILEQIEQMVASGMLTKDQAEQARRKLNINR